MSCGSDIVAQEKELHMQHALAEASLAPFGFMFPEYRERLTFNPYKNYRNNEEVIGRLWHARNRPEHSDTVPIETILHVILPKVLPDQEPLLCGEFWYCDKMYMSHDIALLSTAVQWLATNVGSDTLRVCSNPARPGFYRSFVDRTFSLPFKEYNPNDKRQQSIVIALMLWLDSEEGQRFAQSAYKAIRRR